MAGSKASVYASEGRVEGMSIEHPDNAVIVISRVDNFAISCRLRAA